MFGLQTRTIRDLSRNEKKQVESLLGINGLTFEGSPDCTAVVENTDEKIIATASIQGKVIKMVAADPEWQECNAVHIKRYRKY